MDGQISKSIAKFCCEKPQDLQKSPSMIIVLGQ